MSDEIKNQEFTNTEEIMSYGDVMLEDYGNQKWVSVESELALLRSLDRIESKFPEDDLNCIKEGIRKRIKQLEGEE